jgi:threonine/homoserine/homoserine lactone efflux protein
VVLTIFITVALCVLAVFAIARAAQAAMRPLGLDAITVLLWLGLAERPNEPPAPRDSGSEDSVVDAPARKRRRPPHGPLVQPTVHRRRAARAR